MFYTLADAANHYGINPKALRRLIRKNPSWHRAGVGGRYTFTEADLKALGALIKTKPQKRDDDDTPGMTIEQVIQARTDRALRAQQMKQRAERQARLDALISAAHLESTPVD